jgi:hypothetical protein
MKKILSLLIILSISFSVFAHKVEKVVVTYMPDSSIQFSYSPTNDEAEMEKIYLETYSGTGDYTVIIDTDMGSTTDVDILTTNAGDSVQDNDANYLITFGD